jgi:hypothetical protein
MSAPDNAAAIGAIIGQFNSFFAGNYAGAIYR